MRNLLLLTLMALVGCATSPFVKPPAPLQKARAEFLLAANVSCLQQDEDGACTLPQPHWVRLRDFDCRYETAPGDPVRATATCTFVARLADRPRGPTRPYSVTSATFWLSATKDGDFVWRLSGTP